MFRNSLKSWARNFRKHRLFSLISLLGLTLGLTSCIYIYLWVQDESTFDRFHSNSNLLFRAEQQYFQDGLSEQWPITSGPFGSALVDEYPEIEGFTRFWKKQYSVLDQNQTLHTQELFAVDNSIFQLFDFHLEQGNEKDALLEPKTVVLSEKLAMKYYGHTNVLGLNITFLRGGELEDFKITGILAPLPEKSHVQFDMLFSMATYGQEEFMKRWGGNFLYTYVKLINGVDHKKLESKFTPFMVKYRKSSKQILSEGQSFDDYLRLRLKRITDIHLNPAIEWEIRPQGNKTAVYIFSSIAILILVIAGINFTNLSIAKASKRAKEVGVRKSLGAERKQLMKQFLGESVLMSLMAALTSLIIIYFLLPQMNQVSGKDILPAQIFAFYPLIVLFSVALLTGAISGIYPALYLARFNAVEVLKGAKKGKSNSLFRTSLMSVQFVISIALIICTITVNRQLAYIQSKSLGFDKENIINIPTVGFANNDYSEIDAFKNRLLLSPRVSNVTVSSNVPGDMVYGDQSYTLDGSETSLNITHFSIGFDFLDTYDISLLSGRNYSKDFATDTAGTILINETAVRMLGLTPEEAVGKRLDNSAIVEVVEDFNFKSLKREIEPLVLLLNPKQVGSISVRLAPGDLPNSIALVESTYHELFSDQFKFSFLDDKLDALYEDDVKAHNLFVVFSSFSLVLACMGLFGLAAFSAEERVKEMGVRKVLGASINQIALLFFGEFSKWFIISILISWPLAYFFLKSWLSEFVFRIELAPLTFIIGASLTAGIAFLTILFQALKMARANPVTTLRNE